MIIFFTEEERKWMDTKTIGWPIKDDCPDDIRKSIEKKKQYQREMEKEMFGED